MQMRRHGPRGHPNWTILFVLVMAVLLLAITGAPGRTTGAPTPSLASATSSMAGENWSVGFLESSRLALVTDIDSGLSLPGAVAQGPIRTASMTILVAFPLSDSNGLGRFLTALSNPVSPQYHHYLTQAEFDAAYGGAAGPYQSAVRYFEAQGVSRLTTAADRLTITFQATPAQVDAIFHTQIDSFTLGGRSYYAPTTPARLPAPLASAISAVEGLSSYSQYLVHSLGGRSGPIHSLPPSRAQPTGPSASGYLAPVTYEGAQLEYGPDVQVAYDELSLFREDGYPTNMVVATILWAGTNNSGAAVGPFVPSDIYDYYNETLPSGIPHSHVYGVPLDGAVAPGPSASYDVTGANGENTLDLEMLGSTAPGASIYNVYGPSATTVTTDAAFSYILNPTHTPALENVSVISNSFGGSDANDTVWFNDLQEAQARGISVLASSGDSGDNPSSSKYQGGPDNVEVPAAMAYDSFGVTAVGGVTVTLNPNPSSAGFLTLTNQTAWYISAADTAGGGPAGSTGGISSVFAEPSWQLDTSANTQILGAGRGVPDIAAVANNTLVTLTVDGNQYRATNATTGGLFQFFWGTSVACPIEAGIVAEIDHVLQAHQNAWLGFLDPQLYALANSEYAPLSSTSTTGFEPTGNYMSPLPTLPLFDVVYGRNHVDSAGAGYDLVTGWGSLDAYNYTMYFLHVTSAGVYGRLSGVEDNLSLSGLAVTSYFSSGTVNTAYNASVQQNFFLANSLGAPVYWVQNVIYITNNSSGWFMTDTGWVIFPFYGLYPSETVYEYNFPAGKDVTLPATFDVTTELQSPTGFNTQDMVFSVGTHTVTLPVPGAAYIIGSLAYNFSWQGVNYTNGPFPNNPTPGGLAPQFGLVGGPSLATGDFSSPTAGQLSVSVEPFGASSFEAAATQTFGESVDQTGEAAANLGWSQTTGNTWTLGISSGSTVQGVIGYEPTSSPTYPVTFTESGLPSGTAWSVALSGAGGSDVAPGSIRFNEASGTYSFTVGSVAGYTASPSSGSMTVNGAAVNESITFTPSVVATYAVTFTESGLPTGTSWSVTLHGGLQSSSTSTITFIEPNGTYSYSIADISGWHQSTLPYSGSVIVDGASVIEPTLVFTQITYTITFTETGLPTGTTWSVTLMLMNGTVLEIQNGAVSLGTDLGSLSAALSSIETTLQSANSTATLLNNTLEDIQAALDSVNGDVVTINTALGMVTATLNSITGTVASIENGLSYLNATFGSLTTEQKAANATVQSFRMIEANLEGSLASALTALGTASATLQSIDFGTVYLAATLDSVAAKLPSYNATIQSIEGEIVVTKTALGTDAATLVSVDGEVQNSQLTAAYLTTTLNGLPLMLDGVLESSTESSVTFSDPDGAYVYLITLLAGYTASPYSGSVAVDEAAASEAISFTPTNTVAFTESGLPTGTNWQVWLNSTGGGSNYHESGTMGSLQIQAVNGSYTYAVGNVPGWHITVGSYTGSLTVNGGPESVSMTFSAFTYAVTFTESGLPSGTIWSVTLSGLARTSTTGSVTFTEPNGTYTYGIADVPGWHQTTLPYSGSVTVNGAAVSEPTLAFTQVTYAVTFTETGLPSGTSWSVTLNGAAASSTTSTIAFAEPNGTYGWAIVNVPGWHISSGAYSGSSTVNGAPVTVATTFTQVTYAVTFTESGLPSGTSWTVTLNGVLQSSTTDTITFPEPNGSYSYGIVDVPGWHQTTLPYSGSVTVNGAAVTEPTLAFIQVTYAVTFTETGLPTGTEWYLNITGGSSFTSTNTAITFAQPNGTYSFTVETAANYVATSASGTLTVAGARLSESITFAEAFGITFDRPSGTPVGGLWTVYLNTTSASGVSELAGFSQSDVIRTTTASALTIFVPNGTYAYSIVVPGNPSLTTRGTVTMAGSPVVANPPPGPSTFLGFTGVTGYYILSAIVVIVVLIIALAVVWTWRRGRKEKRGLTETPSSFTNPMGKGEGPASPTPVMPPPQVAPPVGPTLLSPAQPPVVSAVPPIQAPRATSVSHTSYCPNCGRQFRQGDRFCRSCGFSRE